MPPLRLPSRRPQAPETPEELFGRLQVRDPAVDNLWSQQADVLRAYANDHLATEDVALELPTGSGKTLVGLLVAEWRRLRRGERVAFVCPTNQLARQVHGKAAGYGIDTVPLIGASDRWPRNEISRFERNEAVVITNYHHIFNRTPRIKPQALIMDDAHTAEGPVADRWSLTLDRELASDAYFAALGVLSSHLTEHHRRALLSNDLDPARRSSVEVLLPHMVKHVAESLASTIGQYVDGKDEWYAWDAIGDHMETCLVFASWNQLLIRPFIAPTFSQDVFVEAAQRVYLSATLGSGGELERSFGRSSICRIHQPAGWDTEGSGRRYMLAPGAGRDGEEANRLIRDIVTKIKRVLVLAPSHWRLNRSAGVLLPEGLPRLSSSDVEQSLDPFTTAEQAALLLANRYDGIDLPHDACRLIILTGLPAGTHLQERFLFDELGARHVLSERIRTRITQGAGRATRARRDTAVVILHGDDLIGFLNHSEVRQVLRSELQAELELAFENSESSSSEVLESVDSFLAQGKGWQPVETWLRSVAQERPREAAPGSTALADAAEHEIAAWNAAWRGDYSAAVGAAQRAAVALTDSATASYRAWWLALAASWAIAQHGEVNKLASELIRRTGQASQRMRWRPPLPPISDAPTASSDDALILRADSAAQWLRDRVRSPKLERVLKQLEDDITAADATKFEIALECLGEILGFESIRSGENTAPDGIWCDGDSAWLIFEAKTDKSDGELSAREIRQANSHENWIKHHYAWPEPEHAITIIVANDTELHEDAVGIANDGLYLVSQETIKEISAQAVAAHRELAGEIIGLSDGESAQRLAARFAELGLSTPDLIKRLTDTHLS